MADKFDECVGEVECRCIQIREKAKASKSVEHSAILIEMLAVEVQSLCNLLRLEHAVGINSAR